MWLNYLKTAIRSLLKRSSFTLINLLGLSLAFICSILLFLNAFYDLSYDQFHADKDRIYKMYNYTRSNEAELKSVAMSYPVAPTVLQEIKGVEATSRFMWSGSGVEYKGKVLDMGINLVDPGFFKVFNLEFVSGNSVSPLSQVGDAVINETTAQKLFGNKNPIGEIIRVKIMGVWKDLQVGSVVKNLPKNSSFSFSLLARPELSPDYESNKLNWNSQHHEVWIKLKKGIAPETIEKQFRGIIKKYQLVDNVFMKNNGYLPDEHGDYMSYRLLSLNDNHFDEDIGSGDNIISKSYLYSILLIGFFILAIACFNFINLNIAQSFTRFKEVGVRKCLGASSKQVFMQIWGESFLICITALLLGIAGSVLIFPGFNKMFNGQIKLSFFYQPSSIVLFVLSVVVVSFFAGGYPAYVVSKLNTVSVLKGSAKLKKPGFFRNGLIILQFSIASFLMLCTSIAYKQFTFMQSMPLGFNKESVITIPLYNGNQGRESLEKLRVQLQNDPSVLSITGTNINIGLGKDGNRSKWTMGFGYQEKNISTNWLTADYDFLKTLGIQLKSGRNFSRDFGTDAVNAVIVTESTARQFGVKDPLGLTFSTDSTKPDWQIIGIIPDFHLYSVHEKLEPLTIDVCKAMPIHYLFVKVKSQNLLKSMEKVKQVYSILEPGKEFRGSFLDENTNNWYLREKRISMLLGIASVVAIVLSGLGLFALAMLIIQQRVKEIGVRKVLGASVFSINKMLTLDFVKLVLISILLSVPLSYWVMAKWLQDFPYKTKIEWYIYALVGTMAILIAILTISFHTIKAAIANPVKSLRTE